MRTLLDRIHDLRRRLFGRYELDDPRPIAREAPYTFHLPPEDELRALAVGDHAKLMFRGDPPGREWAVERMWVQIVEIGPDHLLGVLDNVPNDMPQLKVGATVRFARHHVIDIDWAAPARAPARAPERQVWDRCMVDQHVVDGDAPVGYLYREEPDLAEDGDRFPDSGWRIRADESGLAKGEVEARGPTYVAIGVVLNQDDSWIHLLDEPIGSAFLRDPDTGLFVREERRQEDEA